jgi:AraC-like DNA-binding protein
MDGPFNTDISMASSTHVLLHHSIDTHSYLDSWSTEEHGRIVFEQNLFSFLEKTLQPATTILPEFQLNQISHGRWKVLLAAVFRAAEVDKSARRSTEEMLSRCVVNVENLGRALDLIIRYPADRSINNLTRQISNDSVLLACAYAGRPAALDVLDLICYWRLLSWLANEPIPLQQLRLPNFGNLDTDLQHLVEHIFQCSVSGNAMVATLTIDLAWLERPVLRTHRELRPILGLPSLALIPCLPIVSFKSRITQLIEKSIDRHGITPSLSEVAYLLRLSPSTLRRQLHREGSSFQAIKDQWRQERATKLLHETGATLDDIAGQLGFEGSSVFSRAFKSWTGNSPSIFRAKKTSRQSIF